MKCVDVNVLVAASTVRHQDHAGAAAALRPGPQRWGVFRGLVADYRLRANDIPGAYFAALAIERRATWVSLDQGFARFRELTWVNPADID